MNDSCSQVAACAWLFNSRRSSCCLFKRSDFGQLSRMDIVEKAVNRNGLGYQRMVMNARNVVNDGLFLVCNLSQSMVSPA